MKGSMLVALVMSALVAVSEPALAQSKISDNLVKIGVLTDMSGPYADNNGEGSVHDMFLFQVKAPGDQAFEPLSQSRCPFIKKK